MSPSRITSAFRIAQISERTCPAFSRKATDNKTRSSPAQPDSAFPLTARTRTAKGLQPLMHPCHPLHLLLAFSSRSGMSVLRHRTQLYYIEPSSKNQVFFSYSDHTSRFFKHLSFPVHQSVFRFSPMPGLTSPGIQLPAFSGKNPLPIQNQQKDTSQHQQQIRQSFCSVASGRDRIQ